eukprot:scaffold64122_cov72-Phaeocystis_antarctica.AAC.3
MGALAWYVLRLSILAPDGNTRLPMNVLPMNGLYAQQDTAGKGPSVPDGYTQRMFKALRGKRRG